MERDCVYSNMYRCKIRIEIAGRILMSSWKLRLNIYLKTRDKLKKIHILLKIWYSFYLRIQILNIFVKIFYLLDKLSYSNHLINSLLSLLEKNYYVFYTLLNTKIIFNSIFKKIITTLYNYVNPFGGQSQHAVSSRFTYRGAKKKEKETRGKRGTTGRRSKTFPLQISLC